MSHLLFFELKMHIKFLIWCRNYDKFWGNVLKYLLRELRQILLFNMLNKLNHSDQFNILKSLQGQIFKDIQMVQLDNQRLISIEPNILLHHLRLNILHKTMCTDEAFERTSLLKSIPIKSSISEDRESRLIRVPSAHPMSKTLLMPCLSIKRDTSRCRNCHTGMSR